MNESILSEPSPGHEAVDVRVIRQPLGPRVEHGEYANPDSLSRRRLEQGLGDGGEECVQGMATPVLVWVSGEEGSQASRDGEDHVEIRDGEEMGELSFRPQCLIETPAARAVAIPARMIRKSLCAAPDAHRDMAAEAPGTAREDVRCGTSLLAIQIQSAQVIAKDVGYRYRGTRAAGHVTSSASYPSACPVDSAPR